MGAKRALIVDDSKSARVFLARALEKYDIDVDAADSAEAAIAYLSSNRPDVIFMDHLMPGMDGLQAVQAIKNNPRTATIPIMMYTSQEGELYLGQARALGAVGVLPKQIKPTDVSKVLFELHLVPDRRSSEQLSFTPLNPRVEGVPAEAGAAVASKPLTDSALREHFAELRRALVAGIDTQTERITAEVRALLLESPPAPPPSETSAPPPPRAAAAAPWAWWVACAALAVALMSAALWWRTVRLLDNLTVQLTQLEHRDAPALAVPAPAGAPVLMPGAATPAATTPATRNDACNCGALPRPPRRRSSRATASRWWCRCRTGPTHLAARDSSKSASSSTGWRGRRWRASWISGHSPDASASSVTRSTATRSRRMRRCLPGVTWSVIPRRRPSARRSHWPISSATSAAPPTGRCRCRWPWATPGACSRRIRSW